jgi:hypothetical protein
MKAKTDNYTYPIVSYAVSMQEIPDHIAFVINIGNCIQGCAGCHSKDVMSYCCDKPPKEVTLKKIIKKATKVHKLGASVCCIMGGTTNVGVNRKSLTALINAMALIFVEDGVGLYSGGDSAIDNDIDAVDYLPDDNHYYYAHYTPLTYLKIGSYQKDSGGLDKTATNQRYYVKGKDGEWHDRTYLFITGK